jgi:cobalt-zinc-cadmium efflux system membrane fusion protein
MARRRKNSFRVRHGIILMGALLLCGCNKDPSSQEKSDENHHTAEQTSIVILEPRQVDLAAISSAVIGKGDINIELKLNGEVGFNLNRLTHITPGIAGIVRQVSKTAGDRVEAGTVLVALSSRELAEAKSQFLAAQQRLKLARKNFERIESLWKDQIIAEQDYLGYQQALAEANIVFQAASQSLYTLGLGPREVAALPDASPSLLSRYEVQAPFKGTLVEQNVTEGQRVQSDTELFVLTPLDNLWVVASAYEEDIAKIEPGQNGTIMVQAYPNQEFSGKVTWIADSIDEQTRTLQVRLEVPNEKRLLKARMFATVKLTIGKQKGILNIPSKSLQNEPGGTFVFVEKDKGHYERRDVQVGIRSENTVEIRSGLAEGERIVTEGASVLKSELEKDSFGDND